MPTIDIQIASRIHRHLAAVRLMSCMVFPDDQKLRTAAEITFRTQLADRRESLPAQTACVLPRTQNQASTDRQSDSPDARVVPFQNLIHANWLVVSNVW